MSNNKRPVPPRINRLLWGAVVIQLALVVVMVITAESASELYLTTSSSLFGGILAGMLLIGFETFISVEIRRDLESDEEE